MTVLGNNNGRTSPVRGELSMHPGLTACAVILTVRLSNRSDDHFKHSRRWSSEKQRYYTEQSFGNIALLYQYPAKSR
jgi:hypothetical protein